MKRTNRSSSNVPGPVPSVLVLLLVCGTLLSCTTGSSGNRPAADPEPEETASKTAEREERNRAAPVPRPGVDPTAEIFQPPIDFLSPQDSLEHMYLADGYQLEAVLTEPHILEPAVIEFDANGRMYVAEMRTYMQNIDGAGQEEPTCRISVHMDRDGDGTYDTHRVFADNLKLPRMMLTLKEGELLVHETWDRKVVKMTDTDGDFVADETSIAFSVGPTKANLEHQTSGFIWANNNWIYMNKEFKTLRARWTPDGFHREAKEYDSKAQWGMTQDNYGKPWLLSAGTELGPVNYQ